MNESETHRIAEQDSFEIDILRLLRRRWPLLLFGLLVGVGVAVAYQMNARVSYESNMEILIALRSSELTNSGTSSDGGIDSTVLHSDMLATHIELLTSPLILNDAIKVGRFDELESYIEARREGTSALSLLQKNLLVERGGEGDARGASVLNASYRNPNPADAEHVLTVVYERYCHYVESQTRNVGEEAASLIQQAQQTNETELRQATQEYTRFVATSAGLLDGEELRSVPHERLKGIEQELAEIRSQLAYAKSRYEMIDDLEGAKQEGEPTDIERLALLSAKEIDRLKLFIEVTKGEVDSQQFQIDQPMRSAALDAEYEKVLSLILREQALTADFGDDHPLVQRVRDEVASVKRFIREKAPGDLEALESKEMKPAQILEAYSSLLANDINELTKRQQHLVEEAKTERVLAKEVESEYLEGKALKARMVRAQQRYDEVMERLQEIQLTTNYAGFSTDLLSAPVVGTQVWPNPLVVLSLGSFAGLLLGSCGALWADYSDQTFRDPGDLERSLGASVLAHVPRFQITRKEKKAAKQSKLSPLCRTVFAPHSTEAEVLRMARTGLFVHTGRSLDKVMLVTSPMPGDGKSTMIVNLAAAIAKAGKSVLLVDADLRRPTLHKLLGVEASMGLAEYLRGDGDLESATVQTEVAGLDFISHGHHPSDPAELLESFGMERLIAEARQEYDYVFIDTPPLLAVADPLIIAAQVDSALLVVRVQKNGRRPVERSRELLVSSKVNVAGIIVNGAERGDKNFGYGEYVQPYEYGYATKYTKSYSSRDTEELATASR
ncbi:Tyrosine-protein kinase ptk [Rosistilla ulvae]|uniref:non-specific protein-tyrosine kinase n=1 Tax=Rosistilla ulvae TaxID=1930277 RepID=A0A517LX75_9BACT|nr:polysaccharide biosynthesis tyrosine autokinase [Rosistilla ulvae]QDS87225.1 Tyrosine-protein kinase ptk [Rosistilla ulvae]